MKTVEYAPDGMAVGDEEAEPLAAKFLLSEGDQTVRVSSSIFVDAVRTLVHEKLVPHTGVQLLFRGHVMPLDHRGRPQSRPHGFCDVWDGLLGRLLRPS